MKKFAAMLLAGMMSLSLLACGGGDDSRTPAGNDKSQTDEGGRSQAAGADQGAAEEGETAHLILYMASAGNMEDAPMVANAVNDYIRPLIHAEVELNYVNMGSYSEQVGLMMRSGEQIDVLFSFEADTKNYIRQEAVMPLDDLLEQYGEGIVEQIGAENLQAAYVNDKLYSLPSLKDMAISRMFVYNKEMADTAGVDFSNVKQLSDLTDIFAKVKESYPECSMFGGAGGNNVNFDAWTWDGLSNSLGVLMDYGNSLDVVNLFETEEYASICNLMHEWYQAGYIEKDFATSSETWSSRMQAGTAFGGVTSYKPGAIASVEAQTGRECGYVILTDPLASTSTIVNTNWMIPASSANPQKAMEFMRLMYTDETVANLLLNGIEGVHYEENEDGTISYIDAENCKYQDYLAWAYGNQFITKVWSGNEPDVYEKTREFNDSAVKSKALGFSFDTTNVVNEITACQNVTSKYRASLECGEVDPAEVLPQFISDLKAAGIEKIIQEKQTQLDAWANQCTDTLIIRQTYSSIRSSAMLDFLVVATATPSKIRLADERISSVVLPNINVSVH